MRICFRPELIVLLLLIPASARATTAVEPRRCSVQLTQGQSIEDAIGICNRQLEDEHLNQSQRAEAYLNRAGLELSRGDKRQALDDLDRAIEIMPDEKSAYEMRGSLYLSSGNTALAMADLDKAVQLDPNYAEAYNSRGVALLAAGDYARAVGDFNIALKLGLASARTYNNRAYAYIYERQYDAAIADFGAALSIDGESVLALKGRCWARAVTGQQLELALADCTKSIEIKPDRPDNVYTHDARGLVDLRLGKYQDALADYDLAVAGDSKQARPLFGRGIAKLRLGDTTGSNADMEAAKKIDPDIADEFRNYNITP